MEPHNLSHIFINIVYIEHVYFSSKCSSIQKNAPLKMHSELTWPILQLLSIDSLDNFGFWHWRNTREARQMQFCLPISINIDSNEQKTIVMNGNIFTVFHSFLSFYNFASHFNFDWLCSKNGGNSILIITLWREWKESHSYPDVSNTLFLVCWALVYITNIKVTKLSRSPNFGINSNTKFGGVVYQQQLHCTRALVSNSHNWNE